MPLFEGKFVSNYTFFLYDDICVDQMIIEFISYDGDIKELEFTKGEHDRFDDYCEISNLIQSGYDDKIWEIKIYFRLFNTEEYIYTNVHYMKTVPSVEGRDAYNIRVDLLDLNCDLTYCFRLKLRYMYTDNPFELIFVQLYHIFADDLRVKSIQNDTDYRTILEISNLYWNKCFQRNKISINFIYISYCPYLWLN